MAPGGSGGGGWGTMGTTARWWCRRLSPLGNGAYVLCTVTPSRPRPRRADGARPDSSSGGISVFVGAAAIAAVAAVVEDDDDAVALEAAPAPPPLFFDCRAEVNMPSGTCRSLSHGIESIVFKLPSVDFVKYASNTQRREMDQQRFFFFF